MAPFVGNLNPRWAREERFLRGYLHYLDLMSSLLPELVALHKVQPVVRSRTYVRIGLTGMELKTSAERKHLGGILRIFAKSVRDAAGNKGTVKLQSVEDSLSSDGKLSQSLSSVSSLLDKAEHRRDTRNQRNFKGVPDRIARTRTISENDQLTSSGNQEYVKVKFPKTVSLDNMEQYSKTNTENQPSKHTKSVEDWGSDLLDVESTFVRSCSVEIDEHSHVNDTKFSNSLEGHLNDNVTSDKNTELCCEQKTESKQNFPSNPYVTSKANKVCGYRKHKMKDILKGASVPKETKPAAGEKDIHRKSEIAHQNIHRKSEIAHQNISESEGIMSFMDASEKLKDLSFESAADVREIIATKYKCSFDRRVKTGSQSTIDEDWSSELLDTSSCNSITKDELIETADNRSEKRIQCVPLSGKEWAGTFIPQFSSQEETKKLSTDAEKEENEVSIDDHDLSDPVLIDTTLTRIVQDEDWSSDLMSIPSSKDASSQVADPAVTYNTLPEITTYLDAGQLSQEIFPQEHLISLHLSDHESCSNQNGEHTTTNLQDFIEKDKDNHHPQNAFSIAVSRSSKPDTVPRFVDDNSDLASDHEPVSDLESQAPSTVDLESLSNETICSSDITESCDLLTQDEDMKQLPSLSRKYKSDQRNDMINLQKRQCKKRLRQTLNTHSDDNERKKATSQEKFSVEKPHQRRSLKEDVPTAETMSQEHAKPPNYHPLLSVPLNSIKSRESVERLMNYIEHCVQASGMSGTRIEQNRNIWFSVEEKHGQEELRVGFETGHEDPVSPLYPPGCFPWTWPYNPWTTYADPACPRFDMYDPRLSPNSAYYGAYYDRLYGDCRTAYPFPYINTWEGSVHGKMPSDEYHTEHQQQSVTNREHRIVDYDSSSEDERLAKFANKQWNSVRWVQDKQSAEEWKKSYSECVVNNHGSKRSLQETQSSVYYPPLNKEKVLKTSGNKLHKLGAPKQAQVLGAYVDRYREIDSDASIMYKQTNTESPGGECPMSLVHHAKNICEKLKLDSSEDYQRRAVDDSTKNQKGKIRNPSPKQWAHFHSNRNNVDNLNFDDPFEVESYPGKENVDERRSEEVRTPGCYPYLNIENMMAEENSTKPDSRVTNLVTSSQWAAWETDKDSQSTPKDKDLTLVTKRDSREQTGTEMGRGTEDSGHDSYGKIIKEDIDERKIPKAHMSSPPVLPVCPQPFWGDPRMGYPYPAYYPPHWMPGFPGAYSPGYLPYPSPPTTSPTTSSGCTIGSSVPRSTTATFSYQYASTRSRTLSAPQTEVEKNVEESPIQDKSCNSYFLAGKSRRISDSVLKTDTDSFTPKRSSYASRLQNDARLNLNFPQLDWKIRFKSRCKNYGYNFIDSHCHLDFLYKREDFKGTFAKYMLKHEDTFPENFEGCVAVFCNPATFLPNGGLWRDLTKEDKVWLTMGCHPKMVTDFDTVAVEGLKKCIQHSKIIAVGEIGLDYSGTFRQHEDLQKKMFAFQLQLALDVKKPLVIHCRQAEEDCLEIMEKIVPRNYKIHCHCFTGSYEQCQKWLSKFPNLYIGLTNLVSFRSATPTHEVARNIPLSRLLLETDTPYFVPRQVPKGEFELSHPGMAIFVAEEIARIKQIPVNAVLKACRSNTTDVYGI